MPRHLSLPGPIPPCHLPDPQLPDPDFIGREQILKHLDEWLLPGKDTVQFKEIGTRSLTIEGFQGSGKTQLCAQWVNRNQSRFDDIFWLDARNERTLAWSFDRILK